LCFRDALLKMREVYDQNPQMGDAHSVAPRLEEVKQSLERQEEELRRNQVLRILCTHSIHIVLQTVLYILIVLYERIVATL